MPTILSAPSTPAHRLLSEIPTGRMAKADLKNVDVCLRAGIGRCIERARKSLGWSQKELKAAIEQATAAPRDIAQLSRWEAGKERPQLDVLFAVVELRGPLVIELARLSDAVDVFTTIMIRRLA